MIDTGYLELVPISDLVPHEEIVEEKIGSLKADVLRDEFLQHPIVCYRTSQNYIVLDGHHRFRVIGSLGLAVAPVQVVSREQITLSYWYHVIHNSVSKLNGISMDFQEGHVCTCGSDEGHCFKIPRVKSIDIDEQIWSIFNLYGQSRYTRVGQVTENYRWVTFNGLTFDEIIELAVQGRVVPSDVTRFLIKYRILNLKVPLSILVNQSEARFNEIRRKLKSARVYEEPTIWIE